MGNTAHVKWTGTRDTTWFAFAVHSDGKIVNGKARNETLIDCVATQGSECALDLSAAEDGEKVKIYVVAARNPEIKAVVACVHRNVDTPVKIVSAPPMTDPTAADGFAVSAPGAMPETKDVILYGDDIQAEDALEYSGDGAPGLEDTDLYADVDGLEAVPAFGQDDNSVSIPME